MFGHHGQRLQAAGGTDLAQQRLTALVGRGPGWIETGHRQHHRAHALVGFEANDDADVGGYQRCQSYRLETSAAQALVWLADDVQEQLNGQEFVQWPIAGQHVLAPRIIDGQAVWVEPSTNAVTAPIGELFAAPITPDREWI